MFAVLGLLPALLPGQQAYRYLSLEHFTNTYCGICASQNPTLHNTLAAQPGIWHHISYHPSIPYQNCTLYQHNPVENEARRTFYNVGGTPKLYLWGTSSAAGGVLLPQAKIDQFKGQEALVGVTVVETPKPAGYDVEVRLRTYGEPPVGNYRLFVAVAEKLLPFNAPNGETEHHNVFRKMLPGVEGQAVTLPAPGTAATYTFSYEFDATWNTAEIYVVAFVQNMDNKEVLNSGTRYDLRLGLSATAADTTGGSATVQVTGGQPPYDIAWSDALAQTGETATGLAAGTYRVRVTDAAGVFAEDTVVVPAALALADPLPMGWRVYPNPVGEVLTLDFGSGLPAPLAFEVLNLQGQPVLRGQVPAGQQRAQPSLAGLPAGSYILLLRTPAQVYRQRIVRY
ncbi:MAG: hypothetical protein OHK0039_36660 [Bacteroidia bacterium]